MKKTFLKLLLINLCLSTALISIPNINGDVFAQELQTILPELNKINVKFSLHEGDIIIGKVILDNNYNFVSATSSNDSIIVTITDGQVELYELKPDTEYKDISLYLTDSNNNTYTFKLNDFKTPNKNSLIKSNVSINIHENNFIGVIDLDDKFSKNIDGIKSVTISDDSITINVIDGIIRLHNLKNDTTYSDLKIKIIDNKNNIFESNLNTFYVPSKNLKSLDVKVSSYKNNYTGEISIPENIIPIRVELSNKNIIIDTIDGDINLLELKPQTTYKDLILTIIDNENKKHIFKLNTFSTINKNFSYIDVEILKNNDSISIKLLLPDDLEISNAKISDPNIKFKIIDNQLFLLNLKNETNYNNLKVIVQDKSNKLHNFIINEFSTSLIKVDINALNIYVENAYKKALNRSDLDKDGFEFWIEQLSTHKISARDFIINLLNTDEFIKNSKNSKDKITKIYTVMFKRDPDVSGLNYWIDEYDKNLTITKNEKTSVLNIVKQMLNSQEFKSIVNKIGIKY